MHVHYGARVTLGQSGGIYGQYCLYNLECVLRVPDIKHGRYLDVRWLHTIIIMSPVAIYFSAVIR